MAHIDTTKGKERCHLVQEEVRAAAEEDLAGWSEQGTRDCGQDGEEGDLA